MKLRKFQNEILKTYEDIVSGKEQRKTVVADVWPGSGKSLLPVIAFEKLKKAGLVDKIVWIVPRTNLKTQADDIFRNLAWRKYFDHSYDIYRAENEGSLTKGTDGYVTTYQAISYSPTLHLHEIKNHRYLFVADEFHHLCDDDDMGRWRTYIDPLLAHSQYQLLMTGTMVRSRDSKLPYIEYEKHGGLEYAKTDNSGKNIVVQYSFKEALAEKAIIPFHFMKENGKAQWRDGKDKLITIDKLEDAKGKDASRALNVILDTEYAKQLLDRSYNSWTSRRTQFPTSKLLIIASTQEQARQSLVHIKSKVGSVRCGLAVHDNPKAPEVIKHFKKNYQDKKAIDVMATVAMAYEGLDVPEISHIACLTFYRTFPWLTQAFARASRIDNTVPYESQTAFILVPTDENMIRVISNLETQQVAAVNVQEDEELDTIEEGTIIESIEDEIITPIGSELTTESTTDINEQTVHMPVFRVAKANAVLQKHSLDGIVTPLVLETILQEYSVSQPIEEPSAELDELDVLDFEEPATQAESETEKHKKVRDHLTKNVEQWVKLHKNPSKDQQKLFKYANALINKCMGVKKRDYATTAQLHKGVTFVQGKIKNGELLALNHKLKHSYGY